MNTILSILVKLYVAIYSLKFIPAAVGVSFAAARCGYDSNTIKARSSEAVGVGMLEALLKMPLKNNRWGVAVAAEFGRHIGLNLKVAGWDPTRLHKKVKSLE